MTINKPVLFAGQQEYKQDLATFRQKLVPLKSELNDLRVLQRKGDRLEKADERLEAVNKEKGYKPGQLTRKGFAFTARWAAAGAVLGQFVKMAFKGQDLSGKQTPDPEKVRQNGELRDVIESLRKETDPAREQWLKEFEQENGKLSKVEKYALNDW